MGIKDKDQELEERSLEEAEPGELVRSPDGVLLPKAGRDKSGRGISGMRPKPNLARVGPADARQRGLFEIKPDGGLEKVGDGAKRNLGRVLGWPDEEDLDDEIDETPTRPDAPVSINAQQTEDSLPDASIHRPTVLVQPDGEIPMPIPAVVIPPLGDVSRFEPDLDADEDEGRHMVTIPDIGAIRFGAREEIARVDVLTEQVRAERARYARPDGSTYVPDEILEKRKQTSEKPDTRERTLVLLQMSHNYEIAWWQSNNALVRIWGQLNCGSRILEDEQIIADLKELLGEVVLIENHHGEMIPVVWEIGFIQTHQPGLRSAIREKYSKANLDAIIAKRTK